MEDRVKAAQKFIEMLPHARLLGLKILSLGDGKATLCLPYDTRLIGDPVTGIIHGGAVSTLMDTACGTAVMCHGAAPASTATLDLRLDYMRAATPGQNIVARAECYHITRSVAFVRAITMDDDETRFVATAAGTFTLEFAKEALK